MSGGSIYRCPCGRLVIYGQTCTCGNHTSYRGQTPPTTLAGMVERYRPAPTDSLTETQGPRIFPRDRSPVAAVLLLVGAVAWLGLVVGLGCLMGVAVK